MILGISGFQEKSEEEARQGCEMKQIVPESADYEFIAISRSANVGNSPYICVPREFATC